MEESRKLKRGLKDISSLFAEKEETPVPVILRQTQRVLVPQSSIQLVSLSHPRMPLSIPLYRWMAEQISGAGYAPSILTLDSAENGKVGAAVKNELVRHRHMNLSEFEKNSVPAIRLQDGPHEASVLLLDFSWQYPAVFEKTVALLDKIVFWVTEDLDVLTETYRRIKWASAVNGRLECMLAYDGEEEQKGSSLFEKLSEIASRRAVADLSWLGCCPVSRMTAAGGRAPRFDLEQLLSHTNPLTMGEKRALLHSVLV